MNNADKIKLFRELLNWKDIMAHTSVHLDPWDYYCFEGKTNDCDYEERCLINYSNAWFDLIDKNIIDTYHTKRKEEKYRSDYISSEVIKDSLMITIFKYYYNRELDKIRISIRINHENLERFLTMLEENILLSSIENKESKTTKRGRL